MNKQLKPRSGPINKIVNTSMNQQLKMLKN